MTVRAVVRGVGHYLPARAVPNAEFEARLDTTDEWIRSRSGIERRHFASAEETTSFMGAEAARRALARAGWGADMLDAVIVATSTPDLTFPSAATMVQKALGMRSGFAFDLQAVCAGFVYALTTANALIVAGQARRVAVIGAETFSKILDWTDRSTCVLFEAAEGDGTAADRGVLSADLNSDGTFRDLLYVDGGIAAGHPGHLRMEGREVFRHAVEKLARTAEAALHRAGLTGADVDWIVPHQANLRIIRATAQKMGVPMERVVVTVQDHGNTSAASIPLALSVGVERLAWGAVVLRW